MIRLKKMMALVIALVMVICTMNMGIFAATGDLNPDQTITIMGLDKGDEVHLYQVLRWVSGEGWRLPENGKYDALIDKDNQNYYVPNVELLVKNKQAVTLSKDDLDKIAAVAKAADDAVKNQKVDTPPYTYETKEVPGMYLALVTPGTAGVVYNPIIVSADFSTNPDTSVINASNAKMGSSSVAKKEKITVDKKVTGGTGKLEDDHTHKVGDIVEFTITTKIPAYSDVFTDPTFKITDTLSNGLKMVVDNTHPFTVTSAVARKANDPNPKTDDTTFTVEFDSDAIAALVDYADVTVKYYAKITEAAITNVDEKENTVTVEFSNDPHDDTNKGTLKDKTKHYTFAIDGELLGDTTYRTVEVLKVGVNADGTPAVKEIEVSNGKEYPALDGAEFGLYTDPGATKLYTSETYPDGCKVTTQKGGLIEITGLDAGTYYLKELTAPNGFIRDQDIHTIEIAAVIEDEPTTEIIKGIEVTYNVPVLKSFTITVDGNENKYTANIKGSEKLTKIDKTKEVTTSVRNTKGVELPATGGMGTTIFYIIGTILVLGAGILLVTRRRMMNME